MKALILMPLDGMKARISRSVKTGLGVVSDECSTRRGVGRRCSIIGILRAVQERSVSSVGGVLDQLASADSVKFGLRAPRVTGGDEAVSAVCVDASRIGCAFSSDCGGRFGVSAGMSILDGFSIFSILLMEGDSALTSAMMLDMA